MNQNHYLSFDPGEVRTGWATFSENGKLTGNGTLQNGLYGVADYLIGLETQPRVIICETYKIKDWQHKHHLSKVPTIRVIGAIQAHAYIAGAKFVEQESTVYKDGMRWAGLNVPTRGHVPDNQSAVGHGVYYLYKVEKKWEIKL